METSLNSTEYNNPTTLPHHLLAVIIKQLFHSTLWSTLTWKKRQTTDLKVKEFRSQDRASEKYFFKKYKPSRTCSPLGQMASPTPTQLVCMYMHVCTYIKISKIAEDIKKHLIIYYSSSLMSLELRELKPQAVSNEIIPFKCCEMISCWILQAYRGVCSYNDREEKREENLHQFYWVLVQLV